MINLTFQSKSPLLPQMQLNLYDYMLSDELTLGLSKIVSNEEQNILDNTTVPYGETDPTWLTGRLWEYNFLKFDYPEVRQLKQIIADQYKNYMTSIGAPIETVYIQCWVNIIRNNGRIITPHNHSNAHSDTPSEYSYVSGNIAIQTQKTATVFHSPLLRKEQTIDVPNKNGEMILFPSFVYHHTTENKSDIPRYTISFDIITEEVYNMIGNKNFMNLC